VRRAWLAVPLLLLLAAPASAARPREPLWGVIVVAYGSYVVDYGQDRPLPPSGIDGRGSGRWSWRMKALASGYDIDTGIAAFRMTVTEQSDIVLYSLQQNQIRETPYCRPAAGSEVEWVRDPSVGLFLSSGGFQVNHAFGDRLAGCHVGAHAMSLYDGASPAETAIARGTFRPRRERVFQRTWTQQISLDRTHEPESGSAHSFQAEGTITISVRRLSRRAAAALRSRLRGVPVARAVGVRAAGQRPGVSPPDAMGQPVSEPV
jgi:hypothetical protein